MRIMHTMLRVGDLNRALAFYTEVALRELRRKDCNRPLYQRVCRL
jgi:catechol 2,3-dioxygenase-like lactoylglutathione lyase family enzyme